MHNTSAMWTAVEPVKRKHYGLGVKKVKQVFPSIARVSQGTEAVRHSVEYGGTSQLVRKTEGATVTPLTVRQGTPKTWLYDIYAGECTQTFELARDNKVKELQRMFQTMGRSVAMTPDYIFAQFLGRAFNSSFPATADGKELCATDHLIIGTSSSTGSNELTTAAALSETSLEDVYTQLRTGVGADGMLANIMAEKLVVPAALEIAAKKLTKPGKTLGSANNDPKVVGSDLELVVNPFLDTHSTTRWFVMTDWDLGGVFWEWDIKSETFEDQDVSTFAKKSVVFFRARHGCDDWRHIFGVAFNG